MSWRPELGFWPATTDEAANERHRRHNKNADYWLARSHRFDYLRHPPQKRRAWGEVPDRAARVFKECCLVAGAHGLRGLTGCGQGVSPTPFLSYSGVVLKRRFVPPKGGHGGMARVAGGRCDCHRHPGWMLDVTRCE